jgi:hypothetical protein
VSKTVLRHIKSKVGCQGWVLERSNGCVFESVETMARGIFTIPSGFSLASQCGGVWGPGAPLEVGLRWHTSDPFD